VIGIGAIFYKIKSDSQIETAEEKACKSSIMHVYWDKTAPLLKEKAALPTADIDQYIKETKERGDQLENIDHDFLKKLWVCHVQNLSAGDKDKIESQGRWQEYQTLPDVLWDVLKRYQMTDAFDLLVRYGHLNTANEIRDWHQKADRRSGQ
jgi:hypothetical protein